MGPEKVKIEGSVEKETLERLRWLASRDGITLGEAIDRAVANNVFFASVVDSGGNVITEDAPGKFRKVTLK
jgi:hypothetical protein